jgi:hypothetical protein
MANLKCAFPECTVDVTAPHIVCVHHWHTIPARVKDQIQARIRGWKDEAQARSLLVSWLRSQKGYRK